jgi:hypothetical protein
MPVSQTISKKRFLVDCDWFKSLSKRPCLTQHNSDADDALNLSLYYDIDDEEDSELFIIKSIPSQNNICLDCDVEVIGSCPKSQSLQFIDLSESDDDSSDQSDDTMPIELDSLLNDDNVLTTSIFIEHEEPAATEEIQYQSIEEYLSILDSDDAVVVMPIEEEEEGSLPESFDFEYHSIPVVSEEEPTPVTIWDAILSMPLVEESPTVHVDTLDSLHTTDDMVHIPLESVDVQDLFDLI